MSQATPLRPAPLTDGGARARTMFIHDLTLDCRIGVHRHEQDVGQRVRINIELAVRDGGPIDDNIANVVSYDDIVAGVKAIVARGHVNLVETLAERIGDFCVADARVAAVRVRVEKLDAIREAASVGVEIERGAERC